MENKRFDPALLVAVFALVISCVSTWISLSESRLLREQHAMMSEEKAGSVWPYVEAAQFNDYEDANNYVVVTYGVRNKGIGPAILNDVIYKLDDQEIESYDVATTLQKKHPEFKITSRQNQQIDNIVLSKGETVKVVTFQVKYPKGKRLAAQKAINNMDLRTIFCYCSVYGDCWKLDGKDLGKDNSCQSRDGVR